MALPHFKLISFALCPYVQRARIVLNEKAVEYEVEFIDLDAPPEWFYDISPLEKVPVLLANDRPIFESMAICEYLDEVTPGTLYPIDPIDKAQNRSWIEYGNQILSDTYAFHTTKDELRYKQLKAMLTDRFDTLEEYMIHKPFFNGPVFSMVDAIYAPLFKIIQIMSALQPLEFLADTPNLAQWSETLLQRESVINSAPTNYQEELNTSLKRQDSVFRHQLDSLGL